MKGIAQRYIATYIRKEIGAPSEKVELGTMTKTQAKEAARDIAGERDWRLLDVICVDDIAY